VRLTKPLTTTRDVNVFEPIVVSPPELTVPFGPNALPFNVNYTVSLESTRPYPVHIHVMLLARPLVALAHTPGQLSTARSSAASRRRVQSV
jgi:hypothetical protein